jgi:VanZ family protein
LAAPAATGWRALLALQVAGVCWLAFDPHPPAFAETSWDKANHALAFASMAFSAGLGWPGGGRTAGAIAAALLAFGGFVEIVQTTIPGRSGEWPDLGADAAGIAAGLALGSAWRMVARR